MVSLPTAAWSGERIKAFYAAHRQVIIVQQILGAILLVPFLRFAFALDRRARATPGWRTPWILVAGFLFVVAELATNLPPVVLALSDSSPATAHTLTLVEDLGDVALFATIAFFSLCAALAERFWMRVAGVLVAAVTLVRAVGSPLGVTALDAVAPIAFLVFILTLSVRILVTRPVQPASA
jgi:hypothetical protein